MADGIWEPQSDCLRLDLLALDDVSLMSLSACIEPLRAANRIAGRAVYEWRLLSPTGASIRTSSGITVEVSGSFVPSETRDALWIVAAFDVLAQADAALRAKVRSVDRRGIPLWGVESGGWVLALAGVLHGRKATVHWEDLQDFAAMFPSVDVRADRFVIDGAYATASGASPMLDLTLELIRRRQGIAVSIEVASIFVYDQAKASSEPQPRLTLGLVGARDARVAHCLRLMAETSESPVPVAALARKVGLSTRMLEKVFSRELGQSPGAFYLDLRLNAARRLVIDTRKTITEIAILTGFGSSSALSRAFRARFGEAPRTARSIGLATGRPRQAGR